MKLSVLSEVIPCEMEGMISHPESKYFGWYIVRFNKAEYDSAANGQQTGIGFALETEEEITKALVRPQAVVLDD